MSGHAHEEHHATEQKPVAFTVPFILAAVTLLILFMFLSLCDPKAHHGANHGDQHGVEAAGHHSEMTGAEEHAVSPEKQEAPVAVESDEHTAEPAHH